MNVLFTINFRREAYLREQARLRGRAVRIGLWAAYFGAIGVVLGLYGLNCASLAHRTDLLERRLARLHHTTDANAEWRPGAAEAAEVRRHLENPRMWRNRLLRLPSLLPADARLSSIAYNPESVSGTEDVKLVLTGMLHAGPGTDRMAQVAAFVNTLTRDSVFAAGYRNIRLVTTRASAENDGAEFVIECR